MFRAGRGWSVNGQRLAWVMVWLVCSCAIMAPAASALEENMYVPPSTGPLDKENPELIAALMMNAAYVGVMQQARMNGVIAYIDRISDGAGTMNLRWIQEDYLAAASSIPLMYTSDEITAARGEMRARSIQFLDETNTCMAVLNGSDTDLMASINETRSDAENILTRVPGSLWLFQGSARMTAFNTSAENRAALLLTLAREGVDVTVAGNLSGQIDAMRTGLQSVLVKDRNGTISSFNSDIAHLNREFRESVDESLKNREIQEKTAAMLAMK